MTPAHHRQPLLTGLRCYYDRPSHRQLRPHCQGVATVAYGPTVLCAECDQRRSAVGRTNVARPVPGAVLTRLADAATASTEAICYLTAAVHAARDPGASWALIGQAVGVTRQAAQQRWATPPPPGAQKKS